MYFSTIKPVNKAQCKKKKQILVYSRKCAMCVPAGFWYPSPEPRLTRLQPSDYGVWLELRAVKTIQSHPSTSSDMGTLRTLNPLEPICWFLNSANANPLLRT